jgi:hypothetical protein
MVPQNDVKKAIKLAFEEGKSATDKKEE